MTVPVVNQWETVPLDLVERRQWVAWCWEERDGKRTKPPYDPRTGNYASVTDPATWTTFDAARTAACAGRYDGIGRVLTADERIVGADLDHCRDGETGAIAPWAQQIVEALRSYTEATPSGEGLRIFVRGTLPPGGRRRGNVEVYDRDRYLTVTGAHLDGTPLTIEDRTAELAAVHARIFGVPPAPTNGQPPAEPVDLDDAALLDRARRAANGAMFERLWAGDASSYPSHSEADLALCSLLAFWTGRDATRMDRLVRRSGLMREKWDERHGAQTYGARTIATAIASCRDVYRERGRAADAPVRDPATPRPVPTIKADDLDLPRVSAEAWTALRTANEPVVLVRYGGRPAWIERDDTGAPVVRHLGESHLRHRLARVARWTRTVRTKDGPRTVDALPPLHVVRDILASPDPTLPILTRVVEAPVFAPDGSLSLAPGYHPASHTFYAHAPGLVLPRVSSAPSDEEIGQAGTFLCSHLLGDFPFVGVSEVAHAVALLVLPFVRDLIAGPTPLHLIEKPQPGTGASLLAEILLFPILGRALAPITEGTDEDEWRKRITAKLRGGPPAVYIDNLKRRLDSAALSSVITSEVWEDRLLGASEQLRLPVRAVFVATANNPVLSPEITRRTVRIRLDAKLDRPWERHEFRYPDLRSWCRAERGRLIWAALTLAQAWLARGRPASGEILGGFEDWSRVMGGILAVAGLDGFLANRSAFYDEADAETAAWRALVSIWWERYSTAPTGVSDLFDIAAPKDGDPLGLPLGDGSERSQKTRLGFLLRAARDRQYGQHRIVLADPYRGAQRYRLGPADGVPL